MERSCRALMLVILPLVLSGCLKGFWGGVSNIFGGDDGTESYVIEPPDVVSREEAEQPRPSLSSEDEFMARLLEPGDPEGLVPLSSQLRSCSEYRGESGTGYTAPADDEDGLRLPRFSYRNALITEDTTWSGDVLVEGGVTVAPQTTLTVAKGAVVRFRGDCGTSSAGALVVQGRLVVKGSGEAPVMFVSASKGGGLYWQGILLTGSNKRNLLENCRVEGAETGIDASFSTVTLKGVQLHGCRSGARFQDSLVTIDSLKVVECGAGVIFRQSEAEIATGEFYGNRLGIFADSTSLSLSGSRFTGNNLSALFASASILSLSGNEVAANGNGFIMSDCSGTVSANRVERNAIFGMVLKGARVRITENLLEGNGKAGMRVEDGKGVAWGNSILDNGEYDLYNGGDEEFRAVGNWWGTVSNGEIAARIYDRNRDESRGRVLYLPPLQKEPDQAPRL